MNDAYWAHKKSVLVSGTIALAGSLLVVGIARSDRPHCAPGLPAGVGLSEDRVRSIIKEELCPIDRRFDKIDAELQTLMSQKAQRPAARSSRSRPKLPLVNPRIERVVKSPCTTRK
jgi:hypothetical protein